MGDKAATSEREFKGLNPACFRSVVAIGVTEKDLREQVRDLCGVTGWKFYFTWTSIHSPRGFPDLVLTNREQEKVIFAELKSDKGKVSPYQQEWLDELKACGQTVYVWRPADWDDIVMILSR